ncbi:hypothetical protein ACWGH2_42640 [Streptomyces sp. NPDC054871]
MAGLTLAGAGAITTVCARSEPEPRPTPPRVYSSWLVADTKPDLRRTPRATARDEDVARLSPLKHRNLNVLGRYSFTASVPRDGLRPLRGTDAVDLDDDDDGNDE